ncbi:hypothetical protein FRC19_011237 [Serendipita sp. 401]|nr:hypothetical protein FRC19_011237 [Serendipita sp. 401]
MTSCFRRYPTANELMRIRDIDKRQALTPPIVQITQPHPELCSPSPFLCIGAYSPNMSPRDQAEALLPLAERWTSPSITAQDFSHEERSTWRLSIPSRSDLHQWKSDRSDGRNITYS